MKKIAFLFVAVLFAGATLFQSCSKDDETTVLLPAIHFLAGQGYISSSTTVDAGAPLLFGISASSSDSKLKRYFVQRIFEGKTVTAFDSTFSSATFTYDLAAVAQATAGSESWVFTVFDNNGGSNAVTLTITTTAGTTFGPIFSFPAKVLGAQTSSTGSSFASSNGLVYSLADAKANSALIDWLYFYGATNLATICAPSDADAAAVFNNATNGVATWTTRNATLFKKVTTTIDWDAIANDSVILAENQSGVTLSKVNNLATDFILAFQTAGGKKGLIKINSLTPDATGSITIDVKVQQ